MTEIRQGRPPKLVDGQPASTLPTFTTRLTPRAKARLKAVSELTDTPAYAILEAAWWEHWATLPADVQKAAEEIVEAKSRVR